MARMDERYRVIEPQNSSNNNSHQFNFRDVKILKQLDSKFICCTSRVLDSTFLYLMDQHAVHERVCFERLLKLHCRKDTFNSLVIRSSVCYPTIKIKLKSDVFDELKKFQNRIPLYGIHINFLTETWVETTHIPTCLTTRALKLKGKKLCHVLQNFLKDVSFDISRTRLSIPKTLENVLSSMACRGAIKFGDSLSCRQAKQLVKGISKCGIPFQCAHGRCSIATLLNLEELGTSSKASMCKPNYSCLLELPSSLS